MKRYIITGATSFLGEELIHYLSSMPDVEIYAVCRLGKRLWNSPNIQIVGASMDEYHKLHEKINRADVFINLAWAGTGHDGRNVASIQERNVQNTLDAIYSAKKMGCQLFLESGSQAEYGDVSTTIDEEHPCNPFTEYGKAKLTVQKEAFRISEEIGLKYIHLRIFSLFGENDHPWTLISTCIDKMLHNETVPLSSCNQYWNFLYIKDAVVQIYKLCEYASQNNKFQHDVYNIASRDTRKLKDFIEEIKVITQSDSLLDFGRITPERNISLRPDIKKLESAINFIENYSFKEAIKNIIKNRNISQQGT